jgi:RNA polymerase sigma-70 factor (ECF subfamily)
LDEPRVIEQALNGVPAAERELYDANVDRVFRLAYRMTGDMNHAQDLTQETFVRAFDRLREFRGDAKFSTWLHAIAVSVIRNSLRKASRDREREARWAAEESSRRDPDLTRKIQSAIHRLSDPLRIVFVMHEVEGFKLAEIGEILGIPLGTVKARLSRAKSDLREALRDTTSGVEVR